MTRSSSPSRPAVSILALALVCCLDAQAQQTPQAPSEQQAPPEAPIADPPAGQATDLDGVKVVGTYRQSLAQSLDEKRYSVEQVDAIFAEDIGKFPDLNLAESLQRIAGVAIDRDGGEGKQISVRGLGADFTRVRLNGVEALSTSGSAATGVNRSRSFDFNTFASELFSEVKVSKTPSAQMDEGSLGATVDLRGARPFDYEGLQAAISGQYGYNELSKSKDPRISALFSNIFLDGKLGALVSAAYNERNIYQEGYDYVRWEPGNSDTTGTIPNGFCSPQGYAPQNPRNPTGAELADGQLSNGYGQYGIDATHCGRGVDRPMATAGNVNAYETLTNANIPIYPRYLRSDYQQKRLGVTGALQWKFSDDTQINLDGLYSRFERDQNESSIDAVLYRDASYGGRPQIVANAAEVDDMNRLVYADLDNVDFRTENTRIHEETVFKQLTLDLDHRFNDDVQGRMVLGHSQSDYSRPTNILASFEAANVDGFALDMRESMKTPRMTIPFDVTDPTAWSWMGTDAVPTTDRGIPIGSNASEVRLQNFSVKNAFDTAKFDLDFVINPAVTLRAGLSYRDYTMNAREQRNVMTGRVPAPLPDGVTVADISTQLTGYGKGLGGDPIDGWLIPDIDKVIDQLGVDCNCDQGPGGGDYRMAGIAHNGATGTNYDVEERVMGGYLQLDFNTDFLGRALRGNIGARMVNTKIVSEGYAPCPVAADGSYDADCELYFGVASSSAPPGLRPISTTSVGYNYNDFLPSLNMSWDLTETFLLRFGASKTMARPTLSYLAPGVSGVPTEFGVEGENDGRIYSINIGNPKVQPFRATNFDLSAEWYFREGSLLSLALFHKDIKSYIQRARIFERWADTGYSLDLLPAGFTEDTLFNVNTYLNTEGGPLKGFEIGYQQPFDFLPGFWRNFGVQMNYTRVESQVDYTFSSVSADNLTVYTTTVTDDLLNLSPTSYNATLYYDDGKFSARVSSTYREAYLTQIQSVKTVLDLNGNEMRSPDISGKDNVRNVDFNMSYRLDDHLSLTLEAINLLDTEEPYYQDSTLKLPSRYVHTGRQYYAGLRYTF